MAVACHHPGISRMKAEELLLAANKDGSFLIRNSESVHGAYILCVLHKNRIAQYRILPDGEGKLYVKGEKNVLERKFVDLFQLVHEHVHRGEKNGLVCALLHPVETQDAIPEEKESDDEEEAVESPKENSGCLSRIGSIVQRSNTHARKQEATISHFLTRRYSTIDLSDQDGGFITELRDYIERGVHKDLANMSSGSGEKELNYLNQFLASSAKNLERELGIYMTKLSVCQQLFGEPIQTSAVANKEKEENRKSLQLSDLFQELQSCQQAVQNLETKAKCFLQEVQSSSEKGELPDGTPVVPPHKPNPMEAVSFVVRILKHGKPSTKVALSVDVAAGKLTAVKGSKEALDDKNVFPFDKIEQLVKWTSSSNRLDVLVEGRKKETYVFDDVWQREHFCQLVQRLLATHSPEQEVDQISVFVGTWNMGSDSPQESLAPWLKSHGSGKARGFALGFIPHDIYVIGTQESALSEKEWVNRIKMDLQDTFAQDMHTVIVESLWSIRIVVLVRSDFKNKISHVTNDSVKTGIANALGNKGAVGVSFFFNGTSFCFVNTHLTSGHERNSRRCQNAHDIITGLNLIPKGLEQFDITSTFHHIFFFGDLNYRLVGIEPLDIIRIIAQEKRNECQERRYHALLEYDQLRTSQEKREAFFGFDEETITFPPTYRIEKGSVDKYDWQKIKKTGVRINAPSWCDRVLWKSYPETYIKNTSYGCVEGITSSDHKPVFASFNVGITGQFLGSRVSQVITSDAQIIFEEVIAEIQTPSKQYFVVEFHSQCLAETKASKSNMYFLNSNTPNTCSPKWISSQLPELEPLFGDRDYVEDQHLLICVKSAESMEVYGECVLALKSMISVKPEPFDCYMTHEGQETGKISGLVYVKVNEEAGRETRRRGRRSYAKRRKRTFELVYMDTHQLDRSASSCWSPRNDEVLTGAPAVTKSCSVDSLLRHNRSSVNRDFSRRLSQPPEICEERPFVHRSQSDECTSKLSEWRPLVPPRKPRMGQSALSSSAVLPVSMNRSSSPATVKHDENFNPTTNATPFKREGSKRGGMTEDNFRHMFSCEDTEALQDFQGNTSVEPVSVTAPRLPPRRPSQDNQEDNYECLKKPSSINEWLLNLGLPQYIPLFFEQGWDQMEFMCDIRNEDLLSMNMLDAEHRQRILQSLQDMMSFFK